MFPLCYAEGDSEKPIMDMQSVATRRRAKLGHRATGVGNKSIAWGDFQLHGCDVTVPSLDLIPLDNPYLVGCSEC